MTTDNTKLIAESTLYLRHPYHFLPGLLEVQEYLIRVGTPHLHNGGPLEKSIVVDIFKIEQEAYRNLDKILKLK